MHLPVKFSVPIIIYCREYILRHPLVLGAEKDIWWIPQLSNVLNCLVFKHELHGVLIENS